ncbi:MAG: hypothetical protein NZ516_04550 [Raineya sp.]|nr:hypothetical protein [Raineya sp.]
MGKFLQKKFIDSCFYRKFENIKEKVFEFFEPITPYQQEFRDTNFLEFSCP